MYLFALQSNVCQIQYVCSYLIRNLIEGTWTIYYIDYFCKWNLTYCQLSWNTINVVWSNYIPYSVQTSYAFDMLDQ